MTFRASIWMAVAAVGVLLFLVPFLRRAAARRLSTFQARVVDKRVKTTVANVGLFIPIEEHFLVLESGDEAKVGKRSYDSVSIGDLVTVSQFSDGSVRLEPRDLSSLI